MKLKKPKINSILLLSAIVIFVIVVSFIKSSYLVLVVNMAMLNAMMAYGLSIVLGMGGQMVFSGVAFMGIGSYITANLRSGRLGFYVDSTLTIILSVLAASLIAFLTGLLFLRLKNVFCTFATLGFVQVMWSLFSNYQPAFGGPYGITNIESIDVFGKRIMEYKEWFYIIFFFMLIVAFIVERIRNSSLGRSLASIRDNELAAQTLGVNIYRTRIIAFVIAGAFAGLSGSLYAMQTRFVSGDVFALSKSSMIIVMTMLGGVNNTVGVFVGSMLATVLPELLRNSEQYLMIIFGTLVILLMIFMPMGIGGLVVDYIRKQRQRQRVLTEKKAVVKKEISNGTDSETN